jgi:hypothetical protein
MRCMCYEATGMGRCCACLSTCRDRAEYVVADRQGHGGWGGQGCADGDDDGAAHVG